MSAVRRFEWTAAAVRALTWRTLEGEAPGTIAARLGCVEGTVRKMQIELGLTQRVARTNWTDAELETLRREYFGTPTAEIAKKLGRTLSQVWNHAGAMNLHKSAELIAQTARERSMRPDHGGSATRFRKGLVPANKGLRRPGYAPGRMRETQFKKGERRGAANRNWKPVGTVRADDEGFLRVKIREPHEGEKPTGFGNPSIWPLLHRHTWEQHHGAVPAGHNIAFKDGNRANCDIGNLECISRGEQMRRNTIHNYPPELRDTIMLLGAVKRRVRERSEKHDDGSAQPSV